MGDMGDMYRDLDAIKKQKKETRRANAMDWINSEKVPHQSKNNGLHLIFKITPERMDFWPTTDTLKIGMRYIPNGLKYIQSKWTSVNKINIKAIDDE